MVTKGSTNQENNVEIEVVQLLIGLLLAGHKLVCKGMQKPVTGKKSQGATAQNQRGNSIQEQVNERTKATIRRKSTSSRQQSTGNSIKYRINTVILSIDRKQSVAHILFTPYERFSCFSYHVEPSQFNNNFISSNPTIYNITVHKVSNAIKFLKQIRAA